MVGLSNVAGKGKIKIRLRIKKILFIMLTDLGGRPLQFNNKEDLQKKIDNYFDSLFDNEWIDIEARDENGLKILDENGNIKLKPVRKNIQICPATITGLAVALNTSRETLINYQESEEFFAIIKEAKDKCENLTNIKALDGTYNPIMSKFNLTNNHNWKEKQEIDMKHSGAVDLGTAFLPKQDNG